MTGIKICGLFRDCDIDYVNEALPDYIGFILHFPKSHRNLEPEQAGLLRQRLEPAIRAVGVFVDQPAGFVLDAAAQSVADCVLLDNGYGTGEMFDWSAAADFHRPFILAGGLTPALIPEAVRLMRPVIVDISSGVETGRVKDREKILAAVRAAHKEQNCVS